VRSVLLGVALLVGAAGTTSCIVKRLQGPRLTGTCNGACAHYIECKPGHPEADAVRCRQECPDVFSDRESLMMYESLECRDAVEYVDGRGTAGTAASN